MTIALSRRAFSASTWTRHLVVLTLAAAALLLMFEGDVRDIVHLWWTSTTFGHCLFIGPVVAWLVWSRRAELARLQPVAWAPGLLVVAAGGAGWLLGEVGGVALARQLGLVLMLEGAVVATLGPNVARGLMFPLGYAFFMVPFGQELEPPLQDVTVAITMPLLHLFGVPAVVDGVLIHAGRYYFEVAEACSGAKFVISMVAFGVLVANQCFTSWGRRAVFMFVCVVVPVLANGVRAFGTIYAAHLTSVEAATGFDHIVYGWVFFAIVMAGVIAIAWRWFDRSPDDPAFDPALSQAPVRLTLEVVVAGALVIAGAGVFPATAAAIMARAAPLPAHIGLPPVAGWHRVDLDPRTAWSPYHPGADHFLLGRYADADGNAVDMSVAVYANQEEGRELVSYDTGVLREDDHWVRVADLPGLDGGSVMRIVADAPPGTGGGEVERVVATWYRIGDTVTGDDRTVKLATVKMRLFGAPQPAIALHLSAVAAPGHDPRAVIGRFLASLGDPGAAMLRVAETPR
ncbi:exosortase A [Sphingomonas sp. Mn802worker]|uniref:exosortase A n=1 Tax=Sphingomonas sp. Mn802worker TaxID=629773 RepID=UPI0003665348|nr:exosortase A [Sphingomonas sp. Mn802worker]